MTKITILPPAVKRNFFKSISSTQNCLDGAARLA